MLYAILVRLLAAAGVRTGFASSGPITGVTPARLLAPVLSRDDAGVCFAEEFGGVLDNKDQPKRLAPPFVQRARAAGGRVRP